MKKTEAENLAQELGVTSARADLLIKLGLRTREDVLFHLPSRYEDRARFVDLAKAEEGDAITMHGRISHAKASRWRGGKYVFEAVLNPLRAANPPETLRGIWFNLYYLQKILVRGVEAVFHGRLKKTRSGPSMFHPEFELVEEGEEYIHLNRLTPIYPLTEGLSQRALRRLQFHLTQKPDFTFPEFYPAPPDLPKLREALPAVHFPGSWEEQQAARARLVYDEFFLQQCVLCRRRLSREKIRKERRAIRSELVSGFLAQLPFAPTAAQHRAMQEIATDLAVATPMNRLLQGDVGSGKTLVAVYALLRAVERGEAAALMAPTEILAEQHFLNLQRWLEPLGVTVGLHTANRKTGDRSPLDAPLLLEKLFQGRGAITVGTHALFYDSFVTDKLGLIVIDEQHKFGVMQRLALTQKGQHPDVLVMTATPIPRTLAMTVYGDLDVSVLDELPPGRGQVVTACRTEKELPRVWKFIGEQVQAGRQAYVVYPFIEESEKIEAKAVQTEYEKLTRLFPEARVGLLHGRLKPEEKEKVMADFRANRLHILVSTPVIEVGVDVPNATIMVIENAERFGLAQLHQLRGRVGRGGNKSYCVLVGEAKSVESWRRLKIMEETTDGFRIAEEDLKIRGPGDILGTEQSGLPPLRFGDPLLDQEILRRARVDAAKLLQLDPTLENYPQLQAVLSGKPGWKKSLAQVS